MKKANFIVKKIILFITIAFTIIAISKNADVYGDEYKLIQVINKDTTGDGIKEKIEILADEENKGYIVKVIHEDNKIFTLKPDQRFNFLAPYTPRWDLNILVADINSDAIPEITTWGDQTQEKPIHIFRWDGHKYQLVFSDLAPKFNFKDVTGDNILELIVYSRKYEIVSENTYYKWEDTQYNKFYYEVDGAKGFNEIKNLFGLMNGLKTNKDKELLYQKDILKNFFTNEWIAQNDNINYLKEFNRNLISIQIIDTIEKKEIHDLNYPKPLKVLWDFKVKVFKMQDSKVYTQDMIMRVTTKLIEDAKTGEYKIDYLQFIE